MQIREPERLDDLQRSVMKYEAMIGEEPPSTTTE
jgi:hypothetical protein